MEADISGPWGQRASTSSRLQTVAEMPKYWQHLFGPRRPPTSPLEGPGTQYQSRRESLVFGVRDPSLNPGSPLASHVNLG